ncbi:hypothetical protein SLS58_002823 [Diplodia intermedia]|uniref:Fungal fucose-specific lectin protein n=1 Tax=Diplodia intermedia TaxID=856260 RepID=A0ABR3TXW1_9PEZI
MEQKDHSTLEVDHSAQLPELSISDNLPQVAANNDLPEVRPTGDYLDNHGLPGASRTWKRETKICGLRKKTFWLALSIALLAITAVAVGVGVGVGRNHKDTRGSDNTNNATTGEANRTDPTPSEAGRLASFSRLAAANYTDRQNRDHSQVYYQDANLDLWMADLDTTTKTWNFTKTNTTGMNPKNGTAISAYNWPWPSGAQCDFHMRFLSTTNTIRALYARDAGPSTAPWSAPASLDNIWQATADSSLVLHGGDCGSAFCDGVDFMAPIPLVARRNDTFPRAAVYLAANNGSLTELYYAAGQPWNVTDMSVPNMTLDAGSQLAALSHIDADGLLYVQVLATRAGGGAAVAYLDGAPERGWASNASVAGMEKVLPLSPIASTQMGRVYALEAGEGGGAPELVEWVRSSEGGVPTFERVGVERRPGMLKEQFAVSLRRSLEEITESKK